MSKTPVFVISAFLAGALTGALAMAGLTPSQQAPVAVHAPPPDSAMTVRQADSLDEPVGEVAEPAAAAAGPVAQTPPADPELQARVQELSRGWTRLEGEIARLQTRIDGLERRLAAAPVSEPAAAEAKEPSEERRSALVRAGLAEDVAADLVWREAQAELDRLELRDLALREGWFGSDRYREELRRIEREAPRLRTEVGDEVYDRYLFATGEQNRVRVSSVIPGSAAEDSGLRAGDMIEYYDGGKVFNFAELRRATSEGERGELVPVQIRRADSLIQTWLPRGPLGIRLDMGRVDPDA